MLTRNEFDAAVKDALRHYSRADMLAGNPLLRAQVTRRRGADTTVQSLRAMLAESAEALFANSRDQKLYRVLELTYLNPAPKQEAAADRLGMPFSTYRRHLTASVGRLTDWLWQREQEQVFPDQKQPAETVDASDEAARPLSIVVLPFLNLSQDPGSDYLVDGIVDSLITDLSRALPGSFVISRSTAFSYKSRTVPVRQIGRELRVRYVLEGSVLVGEDRIRVNAQLVDAQTDEHLWAERFDKQRRDILQVQDEIVARLSRSVGLEMVLNEAQRSRNRGDEGRDAADLVMRGNALVADMKRKEVAIEAISLFKRALALDSDNVEAMVGIASTRVYQYVNQFQTSGRDELLVEADVQIARAIVLAPDHIGVRRARAVMLRASGRFENAIIAAQSVIALNPGEPTAYRELGLNNLYLGLTREAAEWFQRADSIAPLDRSRWTWLQGLGRAMMQMEQDAEAVEPLRLAAHGNPNVARVLVYLAAAEALVGNIDAAKRHLSQVDEIDPGLTIKRLVEERSSVPLASVSPIYRRENERILDALRRAGMPER